MDGNPLLIWTIPGLFLWAYLKTAQVGKSILKVKPSIYKAKKSKELLYSLYQYLLPSCLLNLAAATLPLSSNHTQQKWPQLPKKIRTVSLSLSNKVQEKKFVIRF